MCCGLFSQFAQIIMAQAFKSGKAFSLIKLIQDGIYFVCQTTGIIKDPILKTVTAPYDNKRHAALVLGSSDNERVLKSFAENLTHNVPIVWLKRMSDESCIISPAETTNIQWVQNLLVCPYCGILLPDEEIDTHILSNPNHGEKVELVSKENATNKRKYVTKKHYCVYCETLQAQLPRHLERIHKNEGEVMKAMCHKKGSPRRKMLLERIQKNGDFVHNSKSDNLITHRRSMKKPNSVENYTPCPHCKGFYSKINLYNHVRHCKYQSTMKYGRSLQAASRAVLPRIHERACETLKEEIFPKMSDDEVTNAIRYDLHVIEFANLLAIKYSTSSHHNKMIRNKLRHLGRILLEMRKLYPDITDMASIFKPKHFDDFIKALHIMGGLKNGKFLSPSLGPTCITLIRKMGGVVESIAIKNSDKQLQTDVDNFLKLLHTMGNSLVSKIASENRTQHQRSQKSDFLKTQDIQRLYHELGCEMKICVESLLISFDKTKWMTLTKATLVHIMVFNRRRPGDVEKSQLTEYATLQTVPSECLEMIDDNKKRLAMTYGRYITRGKLNSPSPLLVSDIDMSAIKVILKYRRDAKVEDNNPYLFAQPAGTATRFVSAGLALKEFCLQKGLHNVNVTATKMRKHLATVTGNLEHEKVHMVSDFMGHSIDIHKKIYNQRAIVNDICDMGQVLLNAIGEESSILNQNKELMRIEPCDENQLRDDINRLSDSENNIQLPIAPEGYVTPQESDDDVADFISYQPDLSTITEVDTSQENTSNIGMKQKSEKKIKSIHQSRYGMRRIGAKSTWTTPERKEARRIFKQYLERSDDIPSLETCEEFKSGNDALSRRSSVQIRAWIRAEQKRISNKESNKTRSGWTTPTKELCRERFKNFYKTHRYPDYSELQDAIDTEPLLSGTTTIKLRSHLQHDYKYVEKKKEVYEKL